MRILSEGHSGPGSGVGVEIVSSLLSHAPAIVTIMPINKLRITGYFIQVFFTIKTKILPLSWPGPHKIPLKVAVCTFFTVGCLHLQLLTEVYFD
jgi:hypothetical protein